MITVVRLSDRMRASSPAPIRMRASRTTHRPERPWLVRTAQTVVNGQSFLTGVPLIAA